MYQKSVLLADEMTMVREGLAAILRATTQYTVCDQCGDPDDALRTILSRRPDFAVLDANLTPEHSLDIMREVRSRGMETKFIFLAGRPDRNMLLTAMREGVSGFLPKAGPAAHLVEALDQISLGRVYLSPLLNFRSTRVMDMRTQRDTLSSLSTREMQVFELLVDGVRAKEIAARLKLSPKTVDSHRASLMRKLDIYDVAGLVKYAIHHNLTSAV